MARPEQPRGGPIRRAAPVRATSVQVAMTERIWSAARSQVKYRRLSGAAAAQLSYRASSRSADMPGRLRGGRPPPPPRPARPLVDHLGHRAGSATDARQAAGERLREDDAEALEP